MLYPLTVGVIHNAKFGDQFISMLSTVVLTFMHLDTIMKDNLKHEKKKKLNCDQKLQNNLM